jgi:penicillin-binding protein 2
MDTDSTQVRLSAVGIVAVSLFLALFMRLWFLQGIDRQAFEAASVSNRVRVIHEEGPRGRILDRNGKILVDSETSIVVSLDREPLRKMEETERHSVFVSLADTLQQLGVPTKLSLIEKRFADLRYAPQEYVPIAEDVDPSVEIYLMERAERYPGIIVERKAIRSYPYGNLAAHLLGYVGEINERELVERGGTLPGSDSPSTSAPTTTTAPTTAAPTSVSPQGSAQGNTASDAEARIADYRLGDSIGKGGVERSYEADLRAVPGERTIEVNAKGDLVDVLSLESPVVGDDIWLTIDIDLQAHAERLLAAKIQDLRGRRDKDNNRLNAPQGSVVIQDPQNGQILAMASYPDYDPSVTVNGISQEQWEAFNDPNSGLPLVNWALQGTYAPGSIFKLFTALAGYESGYLREGTEVVNDPGVYTIENCKGEKCEVRNAGSTPHGTVNMARALTVSSDVYFYKLADKFWNLTDQYGQTPIQDSAAEFGLGAKTEIPLPGENPGRLPTPANRKAAFDARPDLFVTGDWRSGDNINTSIGQGDVLSTPLQIANSYATFANGGTRYQPQIVMKVTRPNDLTLPASDPANYELIRQVEPVVQGTIEIAPDTYAKIYDGLLGVTQSASGTAATPWQASKTAWPMAGKTGTAQVSKKADSSLFAAWGPAGTGVPAQYSIAVVIPEAGFGGEVAAPLAFRIMAPLSFGTLLPACLSADQEACLAAAEQAAAASGNDITSDAAD